MDYDSRPAVVSPFLEHNRIQCAAMPVPWGISAQSYASTFDQIFKYLMGYAISLSIAYFTLSVRTCPYFPYVTVPTASSTVITKESQAVPHVGLQRNHESNMPHCSSYGCTNKTGKTVSVSCLFVILSIDQRTEQVVQ